MRIRRYFGAGIALFRKTINGYEIFLGKRSIKRGYGKWSIPGGGYEKGDFSYLGCANREFKEELGRLVPDGEVLGIKAFNYPFFHWKTFIMFTSDSMEDCSLSEFSEAKWISLADVDKYELCYCVKQEIRKFLRLEKTNTDTIVRIAARSDEYCLQVARRLKEENGEVRISNIQRALHIGYNQAKRIIELSNMPTINGREE